MTTSANCKIPVILGPTGSGKTGVAIEVAKKIGGEVISADSRAIYKYMDIGTAKPSAAEQDGVPHWGLDLVEPGERFTVADWKGHAEEKIEEILARGKVPIIAGGTGLYIDALVYNYHFKGPTGEKIGDFEQKSCSDRTEVDPRFLLVGIKWEMSELKARLAQRIEKMYSEELFSETKFLASKYGFNNQAMKSNIYQFAWQYLQGEINLERAKELNLYDDYHLAKRQMTWFKRNDKIIWVPLDQAVETVLKYK